MSEKINLKEDRDFFIREFRKNVINESTGGALWNMLADLENQFESLPHISNAITEGDVIKLKRALNKLEAEMKKILKGKGLLNW